MQDEDGYSARRGGGAAHEHGEVVGRVLNLLAREKGADVHVERLGHAVAGLAEGQGVVIKRQLRLERGH